VGKKATREKEGDRRRASPAARVARACPLPGAAASSTLPSTTGDSILLFLHYFQGSNSSLLFLNFSEIDSKLEHMDPAEIPEW
jgi:hypothetical protein